MTALTKSSVLFLAILATAGCRSATRCETCAAAQSVVESVAKQHSDCTRLTLHCMGQGGATACASTAAARIGKPSDPEDLRAMQSGETVVLDEPGALDVTIPIRAEGGKFRTACGVTLETGRMTREELVAKATTIAKAVEAGVAGCGDCCCK
jgi:hypothetical protein